MTKVEIELLTDQGNDAVVRLPARNYPGIVLQGDSLHVLFTLANEADQARRDNDVQELEEALAELMNRLQDARDRYEAALSQHGIPLPYVP